MWARVDDQWWMHPKVLPLPLSARGLWVTALSYCGQRQTPVIPDAWLSMVAGDEGHNLAPMLVEAGLWVEVDEGWEVHDWDEYQAQSLSEKRSAAGKVGGLQRALAAATERAEAAEAALSDKGAESSKSKQRSSNGQATLQAPCKQHPKHGPEPEPEPEDQTQDASAVADAIDQQFEDHFWPIYPPTNGIKRDKQGAKKAWRKLSLEDRRAAVRGAKNKAAHHAATDEEPPYAKRFLSRRDFDDYQQPVKVDKMTGTVLAAVPTQTSPYSDDQQTAISRAHGLVAAGMNDQAEVELSRVGLALDVLEQQGAA